MTKDELRERLDVWLQNQSRAELPIKRVEFVAEIQVDPGDRSSAQASPFLRIGEGDDGTSVTTYIRLDGLRLLDLLAEILVVDS